MNNEEEEEDDDDDKNGENIELLKKSKILENSTEKSMDSDFRLDKNINNMVKENLNDLNTIFNSQNIII